MSTHTASDPTARMQPWPFAARPEASAAPHKPRLEAPGMNPGARNGRSFRILVVDDNRAIHEDFRKTLCTDHSGDTERLLVAGAEIFGEDPVAHGRTTANFELDTATQGQEALEKVREALAAGRPYALAFMDVRMPPGWDGIETTARIWELDPALQVVICTAYSDYSLAEMIFRLGRSDRYVILKKPFDVVEAQQLANACTEKWHLLQQLHQAQAGLEQRVAERTEELARTQARLEHLLRSTPAIIYSLPAVGPRAFTFLSPNLASVLGHAPEALMPEGAWSRHVHADDAVRVAQFPAQLLEQGQCRIEYRFRHRDGTYRWLHDEARVVRDAAGAPGEIVGYCIDVTSLKEMEQARQRMEVQLRQAQKLEAVGQLAAGIAHEINTPMQYIGDNIRFLEESFGSLRAALEAQVALLAAAKAGSTLAPEVTAAAEQALATADVAYLFEEIPSAVKQSLEGVERVTKIVRAMKEFSHPGGRDKSPADLNRAIESTVTVTRNEWKYVADLQLELDRELPPVPCFLGEFNQCMVNLVVNAAHAITDVVKATPGAKGAITIRTRRDGDHAEVRVSDTGTGIPEAVQPRIFEPFFTTKPLGQGTGQGLAIVYGSIVTRHGGSVSFETATGKGTTFILRLPIVPGTTHIRRSAA